jgi:cell fate regulator YaaT (PSP1 superfamily)
MAGSITLPQIVLDLEEEDRKAYEALKPPTSIVVRYGEQKLIAELPYKGDAKPGCGSKLVIRTKRGTELATMLTSTCPNSGCGHAVSRKDMLDYIENSGGKDYPFTTQGRILRTATIEDLNEQARLDAKKPELIKLARQASAELGLPMKVVDVELLLGGDRVIFFYTSDDWIDFRDLVKRLAAEYQTRIEMHQVNAREEARIVADYERCGQQCCCKQFLKVLKPVSMRSAKTQKATLDPTKISGRCGRLMCCLRYEDETYETLRKKLPHKQTAVMTDDGEGVVLDSQILTQLVLVRIESSGQVSAYPLENIEIMGKDTKPRPRPEKIVEPIRAPEPRAVIAPAPEAPEAEQAEGEEGTGTGKRKRRRRRRKSGDRAEGDAQGGGDEPQRPRPGAPLADGDVESREGGNSSQVADDAGEDIDGSDDGADDTQTSAEGDSPDAPRKRRRRRRRRRGGRGGENAGGEASSGGDGGGTGDGGAPPSVD